MARLSTHVLDTSQGKPAGGMQIDLYRFDGSERLHLKKVITNRDGRTEEPLLTGDQILIGKFELVFGAGAYFRSHGFVLTEPPFLDQIAIQFGISDAQGNYHVPLLVTPYSYSTYRGS